MFRCNDFLKRKKFLVQETFIPPSAASPPNKNIQGSVIRKFEEYLIRTHALRAFRYSRGYLQTSQRSIF